MAAEEEQGAHRHSADLAACVIEGQLTIEVGEACSQRIELHPGDYVLIPRDVRHREAAGPEGARIVVAHTSEASG